MTVTVLMDPVGSIPVFLALTRHSTPAARNRAALRASLVAATVILSFAVFGDLILRLLGIDLPALQVAGGLLLALVASLLGTYLCLRFATTVSRVVRPNAIHVLSRVLGLLVAAVAVQLVAEGVVAWIEHDVG